jgi:FAD synthase
MSALSLAARARPSCPQRSIGDWGSGPCSGPARIVRLEDIRRRPRRLAIGNFDGLHLGHREVIRDVDTIVTFDPHPTVVTKPDSAPPLIGSVARQAQLAGRSGVEEIVLVTFNRSLAGLPAPAFIDQVLVERLMATHVSVGADFRFGRDAAGLPSLLGSDRRFETRIVPMQSFDGEVISSSRVRDLIARGRVEAAARLLGGPLVLDELMFCMCERNGEGWLCRFAVPKGRLVPPPGSYHAAVRVDGRRTASVLVVRPVSDDAAPSLEVSVPSQVLPEQEVAIEVLWSRPLPQPIW